MDDIPATDSLFTPPAHLRRLILAGFMGAGKSTVGRLLAARLGWKFLDLDTFIESRTGLSIPEIFATRGEPHFRQLESEALASALALENLVLALGGGAPETPANRTLLETTPASAIILLDAPFDVLYNRCMLQANPTEPTADPAQLRPNLANRTAAKARFLHRQPLYRNLAHHIIDTSNLTTDETITTLLSRFNQSQPPTSR